MTADTVLGIFNRDQLPDALAALHRDGYGPNIRVLDAARGPLAGQLERAGVVSPPKLNDSVQLLVMVFAPARVGRVVDLLQRTGSRDIHLVERPQTHDAAPFLRGLMQAPPRPARHGRLTRATTQPTSQSINSRLAPEAPDSPTPAD